MMRKLAVINPAMTWNVRLRVIYAITKCAFHIKFCAKILLAIFMNTFETMSRWKFAFLNLLKFIATKYLKILGKYPDCQCLDTNFDEFIFHGFLWNVGLNIQNTILLHLNCQSLKLIRLKNNNGSITNKNEEVIESQVDSLAWKPKSF